ncbi:hypothetical protein RJJ65_38870, partial [Rhizobium hidalgonense]|nr:hypothetical protein [Rhizobium hidalgonense]
DGMSLNDAIAMAKEIDQNSKAAGFYQEALDFVARPGFANAQFEVSSEEGLDVVDEFYQSDLDRMPDDVVNQESRPANLVAPDLSMQQALRQTVQKVN